MKKLFWFLAFSAGFFAHDGKAQVNCATNGCILYTSDGINFKTVALGTGCSVGGTPPTINCQGSNQGYPSVTANVSTTDTSVMWFPCQNLSLIPAFATLYPTSTSCPTNVVALTPPTAITQAWFGLTSTGILHIGVQGMTASNFSCGLPTNCFIDGNITPSPGEFPVAKGTLQKNSTTNKPQWQIISWTWNAAPALVVTVPIAMGGTIDTNIPVIEIAATQAQVTCTAYNR